MSDDCPVTPWRENHVFPIARQAALARDNHACVRCGSADRLEINHITPRWGDKTNVSCIHHLDGLETLCKACHILATREQWRARHAEKYPPKPHRPRKIWASSDIANYLSVGRQTVNRLIPELPTPFILSTENAKRPSYAWAVVDIIAWAKENGWVPKDDSREGVDLDDESYDPWAGSRRSRRARPVYASEETP